MKFKIKPNLKCPNCQNTMTPVVLGCSECSLEVRGEFAPNPFSKLDEEMVHFLHVFIHCEGKIADMEKALGVSYPTVKAKMLRLKEAVQTSSEEKKNTELTTLEVLARIEKGEIEYEAGLKLIKEIQEKKK